METADKNALLDFLAANGVSKLEVSFDGSGDEGSTTDTLVYVKSEDGLVLDDENNVLELDYTKPVGEDEDEITSKLSSYLDDLTYDLLEQNHSGWENNDGGYGELVIDVIERKIKLQMHERVVETEDTDTEI